MNLWSSRILRRSYAISRPSSSLKNSKAELNFKEGNEVVDPYDVIDRNIPGIEHRLRLRELRRLREQLLLDKLDLNSFKQINLQNSRRINSICSESVNFELSYAILSLFPGLNCATELSLEPSVTVCLKFEFSNFSALEIAKIKKMMNLHKEATECIFTISDFPLVSQNKTRAINVLKAIVDVAKNENITEKELESLNYHHKNDEQKSLGQKQLPKFPAEWLHGLQKKNNIE